MGYCQYTDANDDGYVSDSGTGIVFLSQKITVQLGLPTALPGTSTTLRYMLIFLPCVTFLP